MAVGLSLLLACSSHATLFFTDQFNYTAGANLGSTTGGGGAVWSAASGDVSQIKVTTASAQTAPGGYAPAAGLGVAVTPTGTRKQTGVAFNGATGVPVADGNVVYASFLLNVQALPASGNIRVAYLHSVAASSAGIEVVVSSTGQVGIQKKGSGTTFVSGTPVASLNTTHLVVMRYQFQTGNDEVAVWVDPASSNYGVNPAPATGAFAATTGGGSDMSAALLYFFIDAPAVTGPVFWLDEVRIATTWAEVTPSNGVVPLPSVPVITQAWLMPQGLVLRGTNGTPASDYQVVAGTNLAWPITNWPAIATHTFDTNGNFDSTNPVTAGAAQQFFRLLVGGAPPAATAPSITNQPQSVTVAVGASTNFLVGAGGTEPLAYFWFFNTNTPVGGNSNTLALANVQTGASGSYQVVVSNRVGIATSSVATLTVLIPPTISANPTNLTLASGGSATFTASATGSPPLQYQWYFNTNTPLANATNATLTLNSVQAADAGTYSVIAANAVGTATSSAAVLAVLGPPVITAQPLSRTVTVSNDAAFTVTALGTVPLNYQWFFNTNTPVGVNSNTLAWLNVQTNDAGTYSVVITNDYGAVTSTFATLTVNPAIVASSLFDLVGFGQNTTGGGELPDTDPAYAKVTNALQLANAVIAFNKTGGIKVIEIMNDLDLGWNEIGADVQALASTPFNVAATPKLHPRLLTTGVSKLDVKYKNGGLTIFSASGATIRHCTLNLKSTHNIIVRNLKFDELWEWDEASKGGYDGNDWDFIDLANGGDVYDVWIDHCTFTKSYDGIVDFKAGSTNVTLSWCKYTGDDGATNPNSFVWQQINSLESNKTSYAMYNFLRNNGFSTTNIVQIIQGHDKTHLMGSNDKDPYNVNLSATFHHQWFLNCWDRVVPRLRAGNVHDFNIYVDDTAALMAKRLRDSVQHAMSATSSNALQNTYSFNPFLNGSISTEGGAILVEKSAYVDCLSPLRNNQTDVNDPTYTGKIMALDTIYHLDNADGSTIDFRGDSTNAPGSTYFGPAQAPVIPFSWNGFTALPYTYTNVLTDPAQLQAILAARAGAGVINWARANWLKTAY